MAQLRIAVATDDGKSFVGRHFGDAEFYDVYDVSPAGSEFVVRVENQTEEEEGHADPNKARGIVGILKKQGVQVGLTRIFGPNIKRIKSKFVCVLTGHEAVSDGLDLIRGNFETVVAEWDKGEERDFLDLRHE
ncbi:dinitrogenase iron-molybdenum cofactor biosynthesis protein [bacterium]|nr:MAG: dinitrogenase iron-molybdenum cofactor biosynthesis protein [bacterium]